jgi:hypothetical protein
LHALLLGFVFDGIRPCADHPAGRQHAELRWHPGFYLPLAALCI